MIHILDSNQAFRKTAVMVDDQYLAIVEGKQSLAWYVNHALHQQRILALLIQVLFTVLQT